MIKIVKNLRAVNKISLNIIFKYFKNKIISGEIIIVLILAKIMIVYKNV